MLDESRKKINDIDAQLKKLFLQRRELVADVAKHKKQHNLPILDSNRERSVITQHADGDLFTKAFFENLMDTCKNYEIHLMLNKNIVLIGMMGSGKSTIGHMLSNLLDLPFVDTDKIIERKSNLSIPQIFQESGEAEFRRLENQTITEFSKASPQIIATGGGVIKNPENMRLLKKNGIVFFLNRPVRAIALDLRKSNKRPLLQSFSDLFNIYSERMPIYKKYADHTVFGNYSVESATRVILKKLLTRAL